MQIHLLLSLPRLQGTNDDVYLVPGPPGLAAKVTVKTLGPVAIGGEDVSSDQLGPLVMNAVYRGLHSRSLTARP